MKRYRGSRITQLAEQVLLGHLSLNRAQAQLDANEQASLFARMTSLRKDRQPCRRINR